MLKIKHLNTMNHCLFKAKDTKGAVGNTVDYSSLTVEATGKLSKQISVFIREHYDFLLSFDLVKIYYDNGQVELNKILSTLFNAFLPRVEFRKVKPSDYRLFQVADMICTFELLKLKIQNHSFYELLWREKH